MNREIVGGRTREYSERENKDGEANNELRIYEMNIVG